MSTLLCLVRHGVTVWNYEARAQGHTDIPLSPEGLRQADLVAARLALEPWNAIYSSTLTRAVQTAEALARLTGHQVVRDGQLVERFLGIGEASTAAERALRWPGIPWQQLPDAESDAQLQARARGALTRIAQAHPGQRVVCVAHGALIGAFLESLRPDAAERGYGFQRNTSITRVICDGDAFTQEGPPDFSHLLVDGVEYTGEKGRIQYAGDDLLTDLLKSRVAPEAISNVVANASAVESAWVDDRPVGIARALTDGVLYGYIDVAVAEPDYQHVLRTLVELLRSRYPGVTFTDLTAPALEHTGD